MVVLPNQEHVTVHEATMQLLGLLTRSECLTVYELERGIDRLVLRVRLERDVLDRD